MEAMHLMVLPGLCGAAREERKHLNASRCKKKRVLTSACLCEQHMACGGAILFLTSQHPSCVFTILDEPFAKWCMCVHDVQVLT